MNLGKIFRQINGVQISEAKDFERPDFFNPKTSHLLITEQGNQITLTPREISGMRLYLYGNDQALAEVTASVELAFLIEQFAKNLNCPLIQLGFKDPENLKHLRNGFYGSNLVLKNNLEEFQLTQTELGPLTKRPLVQADVQTMAKNEYLTRIQLPGGAHPDEDVFEKVINDYQGLIGLDVPGLEFCVFESEKIGTSYFFWMLNHGAKFAQRCFSWVDPTFRGKGYGRLANQQVQIQLKELGMKEAVSFTSVANVSQIKTSYRCGYQVDQFVVNKEVLR